VSGAELVRVAERALLVRFHDDALELAVAKAQALFFEAKGEKPSLKGKTVLGAGSLLVELSSGATEAEVERLHAWLGTLSAEIDSSRELGTAFGSPAFDHRIEARFGGDDGPDLDVVASECGLAPERVVELLCGANLQVAFVGFSPGYPYLIGLPRSLEVARLASPRPRVPAGSVAVAGPFAGVYPSSTPGGWRLLGRIADGEAALFDPRRDPPARFAPGDRVRFVPSASHA
jgi:allophanate hydrolase subunit 1